MAVHPGAVGANGAAAVLTAPRKVDEHLDKTVIAIAGTPGLPKERGPPLLKSAMLQSTLLQNTLLRNTLERWALNRAPERFATEQAIHDAFGGG